MGINLRFTLVTEEETNQDIIDALVQTVPGLFPKSLDVVLTEGPKFKVPEKIDYDDDWNHWTTELTEEIADTILGYFRGNPFRRDNHNNFVLNTRALVLKHKKPDEDLIILMHHHHEYLRTDIKPRTYSIGQHKRYTGTICFSGEAFTDFAVVGMRRGDEKDKDGFLINEMESACDLKHLALQVVTHEIAHIILARALGNWFYEADHRHSRPESVYHCEDEWPDPPYCVMHPPPEMVEHYMWEHGHKFCEKCFARLEEAAEKMKIKVQ
ncbi:MAG: hypothetical protein KAT43_02250 [Nanoarchaeota archaeon]|nr:hypothetical protein [Nanoarchaeota archaeon]